MKRNPNRRKTKGLIRPLLGPALVLLLVSAWLSCAPRYPTPYKELREAPESYDLKALEGRLIVIDPGHGGPFTGATGPGGTREADVNLRVALELAHLCRQSGARVILTRETDSDVGAGPDASLIMDLEARARIGNDSGADCLISIHHNNDPLPERNRNRIEIYYRLENSDPAYDLARYIHKHLTANLDIPESWIGPGNYSVLRHSQPPAVLGEASYLSHPQVEERLLRPEAVRLEAQAYWLGLVDYFSQGVPRVEFPDALGSNSVLRALVTDSRPGLGIDPPSLDVRLDGDPIAYVYRLAGGELSVYPRGPLANGEHCLTVYCRNIGGNSSGEVRRLFDVNRPPARAVLTVEPKSESCAPGVLCRIALTLEDVYGYPTGQGSPIKWRVEGARLVRADTALVEGAGWAYVLPVASEVRIEADAAGGIHQARFAVNPGGDPSFSGLVVDGRSGAGVGGVVVNLDGRLSTVSDRHGYFRFDSEVYPEARMELNAVGYLPRSMRAATDTSATLQLEPVASGVLQGRVVVIDPLPEPIDGDDVNYRTAHLLADYLQLSGCSTHLTRERDSEISDLDRVRLANRAKADIFIQLDYKPVSGRAAVPNVFGHYFNSSVGMELAGGMADGFAAAGLGANARIIQDHGYPIAHTPCPAVSVYPVLPPTMDRSGWYPARTAYGIYLGLVSHFGWTGTRSGSVKGRVVDEERNPVAKALVRFGGYLYVETDDDGRFFLGRLEPGQRELAVYCGGAIRWSEAVAVVAGGNLEREIRIEGLGQ